MTRARAERIARVRRTARLARLTARRGAAFVVHRTRRLTAGERRRAELDERFAVRTTEQVVAELGQMKGVMMKAGQLIGVMADALPEPAQQALASLQADAPPMAPSLAESVVRAELGAPPEALFLRWDPVPVAAASIGQVHRARLFDGRDVAVKVQYPGVAETFRGDLDNMGVVYGLLSRLALPGLDPEAVVAELRARMVDELDYRIEAANQTAFAEHYAGHPFIHVPVVVPELSAGRVITSEWVEAMSWQAFTATADERARQRAAEVLFRFAQGSIHRFGCFNGDPHPGNYRFHRDGRVTFLDFGMVKRWAPGEWERLAPCMDAIVMDPDPVALLGAMETAGFLPTGHGLDADAVFAYVSSPYVAYLTEEFTFTPEVVAQALQRVLDVRGPYQEVVRQLDLPASFVVLDRLVWALSALLGKLHAHGPWRAILHEYRRGGAPATELGQQDAAWYRARHGAS